MQERSSSLRGCRRADVFTTLSLGMIVPAARAICLPVEELQAIQTQVRECHGCADASWPPGRQAARPPGRLVAASDYDRMRFRD